MSKQHYLLRPFVRPIVRLSAALSLLVLSTAGHAGSYSHELFKLFDSTKNGVVSLAEFQGAGLDADTAKWLEGLSSRCSQSLLQKTEPSLSDTFAALDKDGDQKLTEREFAHKGDQLYDDYWRARFKRADLNDNGRLDRQELKDQTLGLLKRLKGVDPRPGCRETAENWQAYYQGVAEYSDRTFRLLDKSKDDKLTYEEYQGNHLW